MKINKRGISLITLVIAIIIMIILAASIIIALSNNGVFDKANDAVSRYNLKEVQVLAELAWSEAYADGIRNKDLLQEAVDKVLENNDLDDKYEAVTDEKGVTVTEKTPVEVPAEWKSSVREIVDGVPIPVGFVASPYKGNDGYTKENKKNMGLVIYALTEDEIKAGITDILKIDSEGGKLTLEEAHYKSMTTRNQFVWIPVDRDNFEEEFVRDSFDGKDITISSALGKNYWELVLSENMPYASQNETYVSKATLTEATAMYASVKKYGGFYIARYEAGNSTVNSRNIAYRAYVSDQTNKNLSVTMGKYPYNDVNWGLSTTTETYDSGAVSLSRAFYPSDGTIYGVVSTLTYGVQWDTTLNLWKKLGINVDWDNRESYGIYYTTTISSADINANTKYSVPYEATGKYGREYLFR